MQREAEDPFDPGDAAPARVQKIKRAPRKDRPKNGPQKRANTKSKVGPQAGHPRKKGGAGGQGEDGPKAGEGSEESHSGAPAPDDLSKNLNEIFETQLQFAPRGSPIAPKIVGLNQLALEPNRRHRIGGVSVFMKEAAAPAPNPPERRPLPSNTPQKKEVFLKKLNSFCDSEGEFTSQTRLETASFVSPYIAAYRKRVYRMKPDPESDPDLSIPATSLEGKCKCKTSGCLKLYCECFKSLRPCNEACVCVDCRNVPSEEVTRARAMRRVLSSKYGKARFQSISNEGMEVEAPEPSLGSNSFTVRQVEEVACQCRKSGCSNKYCGCHSRGRKCGRLCGCLACRNN